MFSNKPIYQFKGPFGVPVQIDSSFSMLFIMLVVLGGGSDILWSLTFFAMLTVSIFLHELGHAWGNLVQGQPVRRIVMHGGGGFCERMKSCAPREEELIVAMGPIVNLVLWAASGLTAEFVIPSSSRTAIVYAEYFGHLNLMLAIFNLIPVHPLDGGKLFQLGLMRIFSNSTATKVSGAVGMVLSALWIPAAILFFITYGWVLFFFPSIALHYQMFKNKGYELKRWN